MLLLRCDATRQGECFPDHPVIRTFWEVFHKLSLEQKKLFLKFLTGTDRVPILGLKALKLMIQSTADDSFLPVAHTCITQTVERLRVLRPSHQGDGYPGREVNSTPLEGLVPNPPANNINISP
ncbi:probable E3 ubiquitin-protein ligase HERC4 isoform X2 [Scylla paramamosain]